MNPVEEFDLELLEAYLDDALSPEQVQHVARRLIGEPELAAAMHELRAQRALRTAAWRSLQPTDAEAEVVNRGAARMVRRHELRRIVFQSVRIGAAVAAAITVFVAGWMMRGAGSTGVLASQTSRSESAPAPLVRISSAPGPYQVAVMDAGGHVVEVRSFAALKEARTFAEDLVRYEARRQAARQGSAVLVSDHF